MCEKCQKIKKLLEVLIEKNDDIVLNYGELVERQAGTLLNRLESIMEAI